METDVRLRFEELLREARTALESFVAQSRSGHVSSDDVYRLIRTQARIGGYLEAWIRLDPQRAHRAQLGAERLMKLLKAAESELHGGGPR